MVISEDLEGFEQLPRKNSQSIRITDDLLGTFSKYEPDIKRITATSRKLTTSTLILK